MTVDIAESGVAAEELKQFVERIEHLEEEKKAIADDVKAIRSILALRKQDHSQRSEEEAILELYMSALGMA